MMKKSLLTLLYKIGLLSLSCLWSIPICLLLFSRPAVAQDIEFDPSTTPPGCVASSPHIFTVNQNSAINESIGITNSPSSVNWSFDQTPNPQGPYPACIPGVGGDSYTCNGVDITIPSGTVSGESANVNSISATPLGLYAFDLQVEDTTDTSVTCSRGYFLNICEPKIPFDLAFVLDRSGSMNSTADPMDPSSESRWQVLKDSIIHFADDLRLFNNSPCSPTDNTVGLTLFATNVLSNNSFPADPSNPASAPAAPSDLVSISAFPAPPENPIDPDDSLPGEVENELDSQTPGGSTAMGNGLQSALQEWDPTLPVDIDETRSRIVVLFSDGRQNRNPRVNLDGQGFNDGTSINTSTGNGSVKIITMGVGSPNNDYLETLQNLAYENRGVYLSTTDGQSFTCVPSAGAPDACLDPDTNPAINWGGTLGEVFEYAIAPALSSNSPLMIASYGGQLSSETVKLPEEFTVNFNINQLVMDLLFDRKLERSELEDLLENVRIYRNGEDISSYFHPHIAADYTQWASLSTDYTGTNAAGELTKIPSAGNYTVKLVKPERIDDINFQVFPLADDDHLKATWGVTPNIPRVDTPVDVYANLTWRGQPIKDAIVEATILEPGTYVGDALARNQLVIDSPPGRDPSSPGYQKYLTLLENDPEFVEQLAFKPQKIKLKYQNNGSYVGTYTPTVAGSTQIFIEAKGKDPELGSPIQRLFFLSKSVRVGKIDLANSNISTQFDSRGSAIINWRPVTVNGLFVGPGNDSAFTIKGAERTRITDDQLGGYQMYLEGVGPNDKIALRYLGEDIYQGTLCQLGKPQFEDIDLEASNIRTKINNTNNTATITWKPIIKTQQQLLGPGKAEFIEVLGPKETKIQDNRDGSYTIRLVGIKRDSKILVRLSCNDVYRGPLGKFGSISESSPCQGWFCWFRDRLRVLSGGPASIAQ